MTENKESVGTTYDMEPFEESFKYEIKAGLISETDLKCVWHTDEHGCVGNTNMCQIFNKQLSLPVCQKHLEDHRNVMRLKINGYEIEELVNQTPEWRREQVLTIKLAQIDVVKDDEIII